MRTRIEVTKSSIADGDVIKYVDLLISDPIMHHMLLTTLPPTLRTESARTYETKESKSWSALKSWCAETQERLVRDGMYTVTKRTTTTTLVSESATPTGCDAGTGSDQGSKDEDVDYEACFDCGGRGHRAGDSHCPEPGAKKNAPSWWRDYKPKTGKGRGSGGYGSRGGRGKGKGRGRGKGKGSQKVTAKKRAEMRDTLLSVLAHERKKKKQKAEKQDASCAIVVESHPI